MKHTREQVIAKVAQLRRLYAEGRLAADTIKDLEAIPGWSWVPTMSERLKAAVPNLQQAGMDNDPETGVVRSW